MPTITLPDRPFTAAELTKLGLNRHQLRRLVADGAVRRVVRGAYVATELADSVEIRALAVALVIDEGHVAVDRTAALVHGVDTYTLAEHELGPSLETCALRGRHPTERSGVDGRTRDLLPEDITVVAGVRVTTPWRTALDLGCHLRRREAYAAMNALARAHGLTATDLARGVARFRRRRGVVQLRELVALVDPRVESERESWTLLEIHDAGLPLPTPQLWIVVDGVPTYRLDLAYEHLRICVEYDGKDAHERTPEQKAYDEARRAWLREHGWVVIVVRSGDFTGEARDRWIRELRAALQSGYTSRRW